MTVKNILVAYNGTESCDAALDAALYLRDKYDAHLTGLLAYAVPGANPAVNAWMPQNVETLLEEAVQDATKQVQQKFEELTAGAEAQERIHWIAALEQSDATVARYARMYDLTVVGRYEAVQGEARTVLHPDTIAMISGRPVLLIPRRFDMSTFGEHAVVAWDGRRASARALADAMQILDSESLVTVATVAEGGVKARLPGMDIETNLKRHGVNANSVSLEKKGRSISKTILTFLKESQPNLLVMGAYEHSKFRQTVVGGVTKKVLKKARMPILISH